MKGPAMMLRNTCSVMMVVIVCVSGVVVAADKPGLDIWAADPV